MKKLVHSFRRHFPWFNYGYYKFKSNWYEYHDRSLKVQGDKAFNEIYTQLKSRPAKSRHSQALRDIGDEYETFIAEMYYPKIDGWSIEYSGIDNRLEDLGRDLILRKGGECIIIQCKRWAPPKVIHERHVFQLFGTAYLYQQEHPDQKVTAEFYTSTILSDKAKSIADKLNIKYYENVTPEISIPRSR